VFTHCSQEVSPTVLTLELWSFLAHVFIGKDGLVVVNALEPICQNVVGASLGEVLQTTPHANIQKRMTPNEKKEM
jgi:hypothetical protein